MFHSHLFDCYSVSYPCVPKQRTTSLWLIVVLFFGAVWWGVGLVRPAYALDAAVIPSSAEIDLTFKGVDVTVVGSAQRDAGIVVSVKGPERDIAIFRSVRVAGMWTNVNPVNFIGVPSFFVLATSNMDRDLIDPEHAIRYELGVDWLRFATATEVDSISYQAYHRALLRLMSDRKLFVAPNATTPIQWIGETMFEMRFSIPKGAYAGRYNVSVIAFENNKIVGLRQLSFELKRAPIVRRVVELSTFNALLYAIIVVTLVLASGIVITWFARMLFR